MNEPKQLTPLSELIEMIDGRISFFECKRDCGMVLNVLHGVKEKAQSLLPKEKEQIVEACSHGLQHGTLNIKETAEQYFNEKYNSL